MKKFWEKYSIYIVLIFAFIVLLKGCNEIRVLNDMQDNIHILKDSTFTTNEFNELYVLIQSKNEKILEREGLRSELRFYQATDRKMMDVKRQSIVHEEIIRLDKEINKLNSEIYEKLVK